MGTLAVGLVQFILIALKLAERISWQWWLVLLPLWFGLVAMLIASIVFAILANAAQNGD